MWKLKYCKPIDGLRALCVLAVIGFHLDWSVLSGGFLGVDVFFVLSGFLITSLLLAEVRNSGTVSLLNFWARRARRLFPAVFTLIAIVMACVYVRQTAPRWRAAGGDGEEEQAFFFPFELDQMRKDALAAIFYVENWRLIYRRSSYFDGDARPSPFRHLWSLAIEEQMYWLFPAALAFCLASATAVAAAAARQLRQQRMKNNEEDDDNDCKVTISSGEVDVVAIDDDLSTPVRRVLFVCGLLAFSIFSICRTFADGADVSRAYFGSMTRAHEMMIGALAAFLARHQVLAPSAPQRELERHRNRCCAFVVDEHVVPAVGGALPLIQWICFAAIGVLMVFASSPSGNNEGDGAVSWYFRGGSVLVSALAAVLIVSLASEANVNSMSPSLMHRLLSLPVMQWIGAHSYAAYLYHWVWIVMGKHWFSWIGAGAFTAGSETTPPSVLLFSTAVMAATFVAAYLSNRLIEQPVRVAADSMHSPSRVLVASGVAMLLLSGCVLLATDGAARDRSDFGEHEDDLDFANWKRLAELSDALAVHSAHFGQLERQIKRVESSIGEAGDRSVRTMAGAVLHGDKSVAALSEQLDGLNSHIDKRLGAIVASIDTNAQQVRQSVATVVGEMKDTMKHKQGQEHNIAAHDAQVAAKIEAAAIKVAAIKETAIKAAAAAEVKSKQAVDANAARKNRNDNRDDNKKKNEITLESDELWKSLAAPKPLSPENLATDNNEKDELVSKRLFLLGDSLAREMFYQVQGLAARLRAIDSRLLLSGCKLSFSGAPILFEKSNLKKGHPIVRDVVAADAADQHCLDYPPPDVVIHQGRADLSAFFESEFTKVAEHFMSSTLAKVGSPPVYMCSSTWLYKPDTLAENNGPAGYPLSTMVSHSQRLVNFVSEHREQAHLIDSFGVVCPTRERMCPIKRYGFAKFQQDKNHVAGAAGDFFTAKIIYTIAVAEGWPDDVVDDIERVMPASPQDKLLHQSPRLPDVRRFMHSSVYFGEVETLSTVISERIEKWENRMAAMNKTALIGFP
jgi:peptidoglycan/LPS O-acetylase OafA/YrhL